MARGTDEVSEKKISKYNGEMYLLVRGKLQTWVEGGKKKLYMMGNIYWIGVAEV